MLAPHHVSTDKVTHRRILAVAPISLMEPRDVDVMREGTQWCPRQWGTPTLERLSRLASVVETEAPLRPGEQRERAGLPRLVAGYRPPVARRSLREVHHPRRVVRRPRAEPQVKRGARGPRAAQRLRLSPLQVVNSEFTDNSTLLQTGYGDGGAIGTDGASESPSDTLGGAIEVFGTQIRNNQGNGSGGAYLTSHSRPTFNRGRQPGHC